MTRPSALISAAELATALAGPEPPSVLDVRWSLGGPPGREEYLEGHIPGAVFVDLESELAGAPGPAGEGGRHPLPDAHAFERSMRAAGVSDSRTVVVYDAGPSISAARAWWLLRYFGHPCAAVLDGGFAAWAAAGNPVQKDRAGGDPAVESAGDFAARPGAMPVLDADGAAALVAAGGVLLDARAPERFRGEQEPVDPVAGHIPGATNVPAAGNLDSAGRFLEPAALRARFERAGVSGGVTVGAYCGSGVSAANDVLALELAGHAAALYVGSWSDWAADPARPVETGP